MHKKLVVIGGGAAGFFCAINAAKKCPNLEVIIVEKTNKILSKVRISGGGRCNVTHACFSIADMIKKYPRGANFLKKAFRNFFTTDTITWFAERNVPLKTEADGRMFPESNTSETIVNCLVNEANKYGIQIFLNKEIVHIHLQKNDNDDHFFTLQCKDGSEIFTNYLCIASGGFPKINQYHWLQALHHTIDEPVPSLFTFNIPNKKLQALMGVTVDQVSIKIMNTKLTETGSMLITHWGLSGPAVLKLSAWGAKELALNKWVFNISVNWLPTFNENTIREKIQELRISRATQKVSNKNPFNLPNRLWLYFLDEVGINDEIRWANLPAKEQNKLAKTICTQVFSVSGKTTFKDEFVTAGGINLQHIDPNTMQSNILKNLFFAGEILNIDGITGGFNFQNAWTTGFIAAENIAAMANNFDKIF